MSLLLVDDLRAEFDARCQDDSDIKQHLPTLYEHALAYPNVRILELGVRSGNSTSAFLLAVEEQRGHLWSVDVNPPSVPPYWRTSHRWTIFAGDDMTPVIAADTPPEIDVLFIDTSHAYWHTLEELRLYVPRVQPGGVVLMHDTELESPDGVGNRPPFPVAKALNDFCAETGLMWRNRTGCWGLGIIDIP